MRYFLHVLQSLPLSPTLEKSSTRPSWQAFPQSLSARPQAAHYLVRHLARFFLHPAAVAAGATLAPGCSSVRSPRSNRAVYLSFPINTTAENGSQLAPKWQSIHTAVLWHVQVRCIKYLTFLCNTLFISPIFNQQSEHVTPETILWEKYRELLKIMSNYVAIVHHLCFCLPSY